MRSINLCRGTLFTALTMGILIFPVLSFTAETITFQGTADGVKVMEGDRQVMFYQTAPKSHNGEYTRSDYIHPLYGLDGAVLTEDFPEDHLHQRGIYWAWHQIDVNGKRVADQWALEDFQWDLDGVSTDIEPDEYSTLKLTFLWESTNHTDNSGNTKPFVREDVRVRIYPTKEQYGSKFQTVDFEIGLLALEPRVRIGGSEDVKGYGGFSARIKLPPDMMFLSDSGLVEPKNTAVEAGAWLDFTGSLGRNGTKAGITILTHPSLPEFPPPWILRAQNSMQNPVFPGREPYTLSTDEPLVLRYRLLIHDGNLKPVFIKKLQEAYEQEG